MSILKFSDLIEDDGIVEKLDSQLEGLEASIKKKAKALRGSLSLVSPEDSESVNKYAKEVEMLKKSIKLLEKAKEQNNKVKKKAADLTGKELIALEQEREALRKNRAEAKAIAKIKDSIAGSTENLRAKLSLVTIQWAKLTEEERENTVRGQRLVRVKKDITEELKRVEKQTGDTRRNVGNYTESVKEAIRELEKEKAALTGNVSGLKKQQKELKEGSKEWVAYERKIREAENSLESINNELEGTDLTPKGGDEGGLLSGVDLNIPNLEGASGGGPLGSIASTAGSVLTKLGPIGLAIGGIIASVGALGGVVLDVEKRFTALRGEIQKTTGATGQELETLTIQTVAFAETFDAEQGELIRAQNTLMKEFNLTATEAGVILEKGFLSGANAQGDLLDSIQEYSTQLKASGGDAEDLITILDKSGKEGIFSDKGVDVVKEFGLRIREQSKATQDAIENAFGGDFADKLFEGINNGSITSVDALKIVSKQMKDTEIPANKLQTVIADVFGGAGEDAGLSFIQNLGDIGDGFDDIVDKSNPLVQAQERQLALQKELADEQNQIAEDALGAGATLDDLVLKIQIGFYRALGGIINFFQEFKNELVAGFNFIAAPINLVIGLVETFKKAFSGDFGGAFDSLKDTLGGYFDDVTFGLFSAEKATVKLTAAQKELNRVSARTEKLTNKVRKAVQEEAVDINNKINALEDNNLTEEQRQELMDELLLKYPELQDQILDEAGNLKDLTEVRKLFNQEIINEAVARAKAAQQQALVQQLIDNELKSIQLRGEGNDNGGFGVGNLFNQINLDAAEKAIENAKNDLNSLSSTYEEVNEKLKEELGGVDFGGGFNALEKSASNAEIELKKVNGEIEATNKLLRGEALSENDKRFITDQQIKNLRNLSKEEVDNIFISLDARKQASEQIINDTTKQKEILLGLNNEETEAEIANNKKKGDSAKGLAKTKIDLEEEIRKRKAKLIADDELKEIELLQIQIDSDKKRFEELLKLENDPVRRQQLIQISGLIEEERNLKIKEIQDKFSLQRLNDKIEAQQKEADISLQQLELSLRQQGENELTITREITARKIEILQEEINLRKTLGGEALNGLIALELELQKVQEGRAQNEVNAIRNLESSQVQGQIDEVERQIKDQNDLISELGEEVSQKELDRLKELSNQRFELRKRDIEDEYDFLLSQVEKGSLEEQKIIQEKNNAIANLEYENGQEIKSINEQTAEANKKVWQDFANDLRDVLLQIADRLEEVYSRALKVAEDNLDKQSDKVDDARTRANQGLSNQLAFEKKEQARRESEVIAAQKRLEKVQKAKALYTSYSSNASNPSVKNPIAKTLRDFAILEAITAGFEKGGYTGDMGTKEVAGVVHGKEFVVDAKTTKDLGLGRNTSMDDFRSKFLDNGNLYNFAKERINQKGVELVEQRSRFEKENKKVKSSSEIEGLRKDFIELKEFQMSQPTQTVDIKKIAENILEFVETQELNGVKKVNRFKVEKRRF